MSEKSRLCGKGSHHHCSGPPYVVQGLGKLSGQFMIFTDTFFFPISRYSKTHILSACLVVAIHAFT